MSEGEEGPLNIKSSRQKTKVKHSTPTEVSALPQNALGISPVAQKTPRRAPFFEGLPPQPGGKSSLHLLQRSLSLASHPSQDLSSGSRFTFPTRRLSTIMGSEDSSETLHQAAFLPEPTEGETRDSGQSLRKSQKVVTEEEPSHEERMDSRVLTAKSKTKKHLQKQLVAQRVRAWELRQLINIEEAVTHELVIEEVRAWK